ncbi:MAG: diguanylate cyclase (GGDEF)-like protein/PAS domain S-box-containing protein [Bradymonadia bacterium]|jgi:diguanylate cyclase (GGDEF)-like protein/PAS domain S-box-containing protein
MTKPNKDAREFAADLEDFQEQLSHLQAAIRQRDALNTRLRSSRERYRELFDNASDIILTHDLEGRITSANRAALRAFGYHHDDLIGSNIQTIVLEDYLPRLTEHAADHETGSHTTVPYEVMAHTRAGKAVWIEVNPRLVRKNRVPVGVHIIARDVTERKEAEETIRHQATHDSLTGLPNRRLFSDRLRTALYQSRREGTLTAVLFADLDRFKLVNDGLGHLIGDELLKRVANRLQSCVREGDTVARRGGDEFTLLLNSLTDTDAAADSAERIISEMERPFIIQGHTIHIGTSVGITVFPDDGATPEDLIRRADIAMYRAKTDGRGRALFFHEAMNTRALERMQLEQHLRRAIHDEALRLDFQPRVCARTGRIVAFEAFVRVQDEHGQSLPTGAVIRTAEETGLIGPLGSWVINHVCDLLAEAPATSPRFVINVSERECLHGDLVSTLANAIKRTGIHPELLSLDLCHGFAANEEVEAQTVLRQLHELGVGLGLDNFGTANTSVRTLRSPYFETVTIASEFARDVVSRPRVAALTQGLIELAHTMGLQVVGFGAETREQADWFRAAGADLLQGVSPGMPVEEEEVRRFLQDCC